MAVSAETLFTLTDLCGLGLLATAAWLITRAAQQPPITALAVAIVGVRAFAIAKGTLRYVERLVKFLLWQRGGSNNGCACRSCPRPR